MRRILLPIIWICSAVLTGCGNPRPDSDTIGEQVASSDLESAQQTLVSFFDALSRDDFESAAEYHKVPNPLMFLYGDIDPEDAEALLERACNDKERLGCRFYCWKIKDVVRRGQASQDEFYFTVRFEDEEGNLLTGGDNVTPRVCDPSPCTHSEYAYVVRKQEGRFLVDGIPVFSGCWP